jgi:hypothetical protein
MSTFAQFTKETIAASPVLTEDEVRALLSSTDEADKKKLWLYAWRVAAFVAYYCRSKTPVVSDADWKDAANECMLHYPRLLETFKPEGNKLFLSYMSNAFQFVIRRYVWTLAKGGLGSADTEAPLPVSFEALRVAMEAIGEREQRMNQSLNGFNEISESFGSRDPAVEAEALDNVKTALILAEAAFKPTGKQGRPWTPQTRALEA